MSKAPKRSACARQFGHFPKTRLGTILPSEIYKPGRYYQSFLEKQCCSCKALMLCHNSKAVKAQVSTNALYSVTTQ